MPIQIVPPRSILILIAVLFFSGMAGCGKKGDSASSNVTNPFSLSPHAPRPHTYAPYVAFYTFDVFFFFFFFLGMLFPTDSGPTLAEEEAEAEEG